MIRVRRRYREGAADAAALLRAVPTFLEHLRPAAARSQYRLEREHESWTFTTMDDFLIEYEKGATRAILECRDDQSLYRVRIDGGLAELIVRMPSIAAVQTVLAAIDRGTQAPVPFRVFIGHGRAAEWLVLANHLRDQHEFEIVTYEMLASIGEPATEVLDRAALSSSAAVLVHSAEIQSLDERWYPSVNVAHETGFFSARLGSQRAIVVREDRCISFTNIAGLTHLRYPTAHIRETFGDLVAALRRLRQGTDLPNP